MPKKIGVLLADSHSLTSVSIHTLVRDADDLAWLGEAASFDETQRLCQKLQPDVLLLAANIITPSPNKLLPSLHRSYPLLKTLILAADYSHFNLRELSMDGVAGCVLTDETPEAILLAIRSAAQGDYWFSHAFGQELRLQANANWPPSGKDDHLTARELEVLQLVSKGFSNGRIASELDITKRTASFHVSNILKKLGVASRVEAAVWAKEHGVA